MRNSFLVPLGLFAVISIPTVQAQNGSAGAGVQQSSNTSNFAVKNVRTDHDRKGKLLNQIHGTWQYKSGTYTLEEHWTDELNPVGTRTEWKDGAMVRKVQFTILPSRNGAVIVKFEVKKASESGEQITSGLRGGVRDEQDGEAAKISFVIGSSENWQSITFQYRLLDPNRLELVEESPSEKKTYVFTRMNEAT